MNLLAKETICSLFIAILSFSFVFGLKVRILYLTVISIILLIWVVVFYCNKYVDRLITIFLLGHILYGLSGPIVGRLYNSPILINFYGSFPDHTWNSFLSAYTTGTLGIVCAIGVWSLWHIKPPYLNPVFADKLSRINERRNMAFIIASVALIFEFINFVRAGGTKSLFSGKAFYYHEVSQAYITLPSTMLLSIAIYFYFRDFKDQDYKTINLLLFIAIIMLCNITTFILGDRSTLGSLVIIGVMAYYYSNGLKITKNVVISILTVYFVLTIMFTVRSNTYLLFTPDGAKEFLGKYSIERIVLNLNPGNNEFQSSSYNFLKFYEDPMEYRYGFAYVTEMVQFIPRWLFPCKPVGLTTEYRNIYYPQYQITNQGAGYSSFVEGYLNFGYIGIFLHYAILAMACLYLDRNKKLNKSNLFGLMYVTTAYIFFRIHRSSSGIFASWIAIILALYMMVYVMKLITECVKKAIATIARNS
jgi:oligosaccharide repeat unit polymerase